MFPSAVIGSLRRRPFGQRCLMSSPPRPKPTMESRAEDRAGRLCGHQAGCPLCGPSLRSPVVGHWQAANGGPHCCHIATPRAGSRMFWDVLGMPAPGEPGAWGWGWGRSWRPTEPRPVCSARRLVDPGAEHVGCAQCRGVRARGLSICPLPRDVSTCWPPGQTARGPPRNSVWTGTQGQALQVAIQVWGQQGWDRWTSRKAQRL